MQLLFGSQKFCCQHASGALDFRSIRKLPVAVFWCRWWQNCFKFEFGNQRKKWVRIGIITLFCVYYRYSSESLPLSRPVSGNRILIVRKQSPAQTAFSGIYTRAQFYGGLNVQYTRTKFIRGIMGAMPRERFGQHMRLSNLLVIILALNVGASMFGDAHNRISETAE